jgi:methyltransferase family protein
MSYSDIPGFSGFLWLYDQAVAEAKDGAVFVEVGVALGHSIAYLARKVIDSGKKIEVWAVDPWAGTARNGEQQSALGADGTPGDFTLFLRMMMRHAPEELEMIRVVRASSDRAADLFQSDVGHGAHLVLIDAAHDYLSVLHDIEAWVDCVRPGGVLAGDDHEPTYPGVQKACWEEFGNTYQVTESTWHKRM